MFDSRPWPDKPWSTAERRRLFSYAPHQDVPEEIDKQSKHIHLYSSSIVDEQTALKLSSEYIEWFRNAGCKTLSICVGYTQEEPDSCWAIRAQFTKPEEEYGRNWVAELNARPRQESKVIFSQIPEEGFLGEPENEGTELALPFFKRRTHLTLYKDIAFMNFKHGARMRRDEALWALLYDVLEKELKAEPAVRDSVFTARLVELMREHQISWEEMKLRLEEVMPRERELT
ncbi:hypothetical protein BDW74DRAFT_182460 [Aspergillus multicolor]|uniref:uncharacterized protein n=1 Tax=Aspergillus multicolor TaxID=41759 RepID=UPI003CCDC765